MRILVFVDQLQLGGAGRVTASMCNGLLRAGNEVVIACDNVNFSVFYPLDEGVQVVSDALLNVGDKHSILSPLKTLCCKIKQERVLIKNIRPDVIIAVLPHVFFFAKLAGLGLHIPIIACDHTSFDRKLKDKLTRFVRSHFYGTADALSILTKRDERILGAKFPKKQVIYNPLSFDILNEETERKKNILCAGRLDVWNVKGFDIIISIWKELAAEFPDWVLEIAGDGPHVAYEKINGFIDESGLQGRVTLLGQIQNIKDYFAHSSVFALPSRVEGFPMVLMEAMSQGCACVAFDVGGASSEMISKASAGYVVDDGDIDTFKNQLRLLLRDSELRTSMSKAARNEVQRFSLDSFTQQWINLIDKVCKK